MTKMISLRDANQSFAKCVREVEGGEEFVITRNGKPVAKLVGAGGKRVLTPEQRKALDEFMGFAEKARDVDITYPLDKDEIHER